MKGLLSLRRSRRIDPSNGHFVMNRYFQVSPLTSSSPWENLSAISRTLLPPPFRAFRAFQTKITWRIFRSRSIIAFRANERREKANRFKRFSRAGTFSNSVFVNSEQFYGRNRNANWTQNFGFWNDFLSKITNCDYKISLYLRTDNQKTYKPFLSEFISSVSESQTESQT